MNINIWWLILAIIGGITLGFLGCFLYILHILKKSMGIKSWKNFRQQLVKNRELQNKMKKGDLGSMMDEINKDPNLKKQIEKFKEKFSKS